MHTFYAPATNTEDTVVLFIVNGANVSFTDDGQFHSALDALAVQKLTEQCAQAQGLGAVGTLTGGTAKCHHWLGRRNPSDDGDRSANL